MFRHLGTSCLAEEKTSTKHWEELWPQTSQFSKGEPRAWRKMSEVGNGNDEVRETMGSGSRDSQANMRFLILIRSDLGRLP